MTVRTFRNATDADVSNVVALVNRAFQVERAFKNDDRTDVDQVRRLLSRGRFLLMEVDGKLMACVYLEPRNRRVYLGMLSVDPERQGSAMGSTLLAEVERQNRAAGFEAIDLRFVHLRENLRAYYQKCGFAETGTEPVEDGQNFTVPVYFVRMSKML